jgi:hypothetical protein
MKKAFVLLTALVAAAALTVGLGPAFGSGTPIVTQVPCNVFDANGNLFSTTGTLTAYASGKVTLHCIGQGAGNGSVVVFSGFLCGLGQYGTSSDPNNNDRISKSGESQLWCYGTSNAEAPASSSGGAGA